MCLGVATMPDPRALGLATMFEFDMVGRSRQWWSHRETKEGNCPLNFF